MIASGYTLDLYCDNETADHPFGYFPQTFFDENKSQCWKDAKKKGWKLDSKNRTAICPLCNKKNAK